MHHRLLLACLAGAVIAAPAFADAPRQKPDESWGKRGISYLQYRTDAVECAYKVGQEAPVAIPLVDLGYPEDLPMTPEGDSNEKSGGVSNYAYDLISNVDRDRARMSRSWREVTRQVQPALAQCLSARGYQRFRLTKDQTEQLKALPSGSRARHTYLWTLAVDPTVQQRQAIVAKH